jgi:hypothetical protein
MRMTTTLDPKDYTHIPEISSYNHNYYRHIQTGHTILEVCHEDENYFDYDLVEEDNITPLGSSYSQYGLDGDEILELHSDIG